MKINNILKYFVRLMFLQFLITFFTIWYFDNFVFLSKEHKYNIYLKLVEDRERFYNIIPLSWITICAEFPSSAPAVPPIASTANTPVKIAPVIPPRP